MPKLWEMLDQAHQYIGTNRQTDAQGILNQVLSTDPQNIDAWNAYIQTCNTHSDLESLRNQVFEVWNSEVGDSDYLLATQRFVLQRLEAKMNSL